MRRFSSATLAAAGAPQRANNGVGGGAGNAGTRWRDRYSRPGGERIDSTARLLKVKPTGMVPVNGACGALPK